MWAGWGGRGAFEHTIAGGQKTMACSLLSLSTFVQGVPLLAEPSCWPLLALMLLLLSLQVLLLLLFACFRLGSCNLAQDNFKLVVPLASVSEVLDLLLWDIMCYF